MMKSSPTTIFAIATVCAVFMTVPQLAEADKKVANETADLIYLGENGPIILRLQIHVNGVGFKTIWQKYIDGLFDRLDSNNDGQLDRTEAAEVQPIRQSLLSQRARDSSSSSLPGTPDFSPRDGKVSKEELANFLKRLGGGPLQINMSNSTMRGAVVRSTGRVSQQTLTSGLLKKLDRNEDGNLTADEFKFDISLRKLDLDDDGTLSRSELQPLNFNGSFVASANKRRNQQSNSFISLDGGASTVTLVRRLLDRYDSSETGDGKDNKLSASELGTDPKHLGEVDIDGDGQLDFDELRQMFRNPSPDIEAVVRIGRRDNGKKSVKIMSSKLMPQTPLRTSTSGAVALVFGQTQIELATDGSWGVAVNVKQSYTQQLEQADTDNNAYLDKKEAARSFYFRNTFDAMDADNDGKVFEKEMLTYVERETEAAQSRVVLGVADQGRDLFGILDINRDDRLTNRELVAGREKITIWDEDGDKLIAKTEIPKSFRLTLQRGRPGIVGVPLRATGFRGQLPPQSAGGPIWFQKMDRNRDGDVSQREFLGSLNDFAKLDVNADSRIDAAEAANAK